MMKKILYSALTLTLGLVLSSSGCTHDTIDPALFDEGVEINGVTWATRNVGEFGKFAATPEAAGMFYQWNRKTAYSVTSPLTPAWDLTPISAPLLPVNDPCPDGWRMPTHEEDIALRDATKVDYVWDNGGRFTDKANPANSIFLPAAGYRFDFDGRLVEGTNGCYWVNREIGIGMADVILFYSGGAVSSADNYGFGLSVRCVKGAK